MLFKRKAKEIEWAEGLELRKGHERVVAIAGNPNVGKSTLFNTLTGLSRHTGNWPGKTVSCAMGRFRTDEGGYTAVDIPGTYSLLAHSAEEEAARDFICFGGAQAVVAVCDATCLQRSLNLVYQLLEMTDNVIVCVNLMDEAERLGIEIDLKLLEERLGVPVVGTSAHKKSTLSGLYKAIDDVFAERVTPAPKQLRYIKPLERAIERIRPLFVERYGEKMGRWLALRTLEGDEGLLSGLRERLGIDATEIDVAVEQGRRELARDSITQDILKDRIVGRLLAAAQAACEGAVRADLVRTNVQRRVDRVLTGRVWAYPIMLSLVLVVFWLTITGANYPSELLSTLLFGIGERLEGLLYSIGAPEWLCGVLCDGAYTVTAWVVSVMLPPMAIFFPMFALLEDSGYLPRVAYNLDKPFQRCKTCGKQGLTMCMGLGCNAAGIVGCRIIDSRRERLIAMLTNCLMPCNGRFPMIITVSSLFLLGAASGAWNSLLSAAVLTAVVVLGVCLTFFLSWVLSHTVLRGEPTPFTLELPPYRRPQFFRVIVHSLVDKTLSVLGRAVAVAAPAGVVIWTLANINVGGEPLLKYVTEWLDPLGSLMGLDGVILAGFLLGLPANEIVVPLIIMMYMEQGSLTELAPAQLYGLFTENGWTWATAVCFVLFALVHFPCSTSLLTIKKEAGGWRWAALGAILPTVVGIALCILTAAVLK